MRASIRTVLLATPFLMPTIQPPCSAAAENAAAPSQSDRITAAVQTSLKYLDERGQWWLDTKKCVSCHRTAFVPWVLKSASDRGLDVSIADLTRWQTANLKDPGGKGNLEGLSQLILGLVPEAIAGDDESAEEASEYGEFAQLLIDNQQPDGSWKAGGQLPRQKRPEAETLLVSTAWNLLALESLKPAKDRQQAVAGARDFLLKAVAADPAKSPKSIEWYALQVALHSSSEDAAQRADAVRQLLDLQNDDGGWGWMMGEASHAMTTGLAIYFLQRSSSAAEPQIVGATQKATDWILATQQADGSWPSTGTKANAKDKVTETATYWSSAWAVLGVLETLPPKSEVAAASRSERRSE